MVPEEDLHPAARRGRLRFERHEQVECGPHPDAAIHHVAGLHEDRLPSGPPLLRVDQAGASEHRRQVLGGAVHVADRHDAACRRGLRCGVGTRKAGGAA